ncbi:MAG TPA: hypothetical protein PLG31_04770 [Spirochaetota bacterium]|nr:hypothetical protein [Spirochaetota bacterium]
MSDNTKQQRNTFRRGIVATIIGIAHVVVGCAGTMWAIARIAVIGYRAPLEMGAWMAAFNYLYEGHVALLWLSGIGLLRGRAWGRALALVWAALSIVLHVAAYGIQRHYWGLLSPGFGWGDYFVLYYAGALVVAIAGSWALGRLPGWARALSELVGRDTPFARVLEALARPTERSKP